MTNYDYPSISERQRVLNETHQRILDLHKEIRYLESVVVLLKTEEKTK